MLDFMEYQIATIEYSSEIKESMGKFLPYFKKTVVGKKRGLRFGDDGIEIGELPRNIMLPYQLFLWISRINEVIENLNLALHDLEVLKNKPYHFSGSQRVRYQNH